MFLDKLRSMEQERVFNPRLGEHTYLGLEVVPERLLVDFLVNPSSQLRPLLLNGSDLSLTSSNPDGLPEKSPLPGLV